MFGVSLAGTSSATKAFQRLSSGGEIPPTVVRLVVSLPGITLSHPSLMGFLRRFCIWSGGGGDLFLSPHLSRGLLFFMLYYISRIMSPSLSNFRGISEEDFYSSGCKVRLIAHTHVILFIAKFIGISEGFSYFMSRAGARREPVTVFSGISVL